MNQATVPAARVRRRAARSIVLTGLVVWLTSTGCSSAEVTVDDAQRACSDQLEQGDVSDISWTSTDETDEGYRFAGEGVSAGEAVEVECEVDSDGTVRRSTSGSPR